MEYKGYVGKVEFDDEAGIFHGEVADMRDVITFQGTSVDELKKAFEESIDDYLVFCKERGESPDKPFSGQFIARIPTDLHRKVNLAATLAGKSLNAWVAEQLQDAVAHLGAIKVATKKLKNAARSKKVVVKASSRKPKKLEQHA